MPTSQSTPLNADQNTPLGLVGRDSGGRKHNTNSRIVDLATKRYRENGMGIDYSDLLQAGLAQHKRSAQYKLKYYFHNGTLFTLGDHRPQQYYPTDIKSEIRQKKLSSSTPIDHTGVSLSSVSSYPSSKSPLSNCLDSIIIQSLEGYVLPLLRTVPPDIHNMHFKTKIIPGCYLEHDIQKLPDVRRNKGKQLFEIIGNAGVTYTFYPSGTVNVEVKCSNNPFKLERGTDHGRIMAFFGQLRDRLIAFLNDPHERIVPDIMGWYLTECDISRDIKVSDWLHFTGTKIQVKHLDHFFRIYIKSMGRDTVCRVEVEKRLNSPAIEAINEIYNPNERVEKQLAVHNKLLHQILDELSR